MVGTGRLHDWKTQGILSSRRWNLDCLQAKVASTEVVSVVAAARAAVSASSDSLPHEELELVRASPYLSSPLKKSSQAMRASTGA